MTDVALLESWMPVASLGIASPCFLKFDSLNMLSKPE